jgi:hypothetical protein
MVTEYRWATLALVWTCQLLVGWAVILSWAVHFFEVPKFVSSVRKRVFNESVTLSEVVPTKVIKTIRGSALAAR